MHYSYDASGNIVEIHTDSGNIHMEYDVAGRLVKKIDTDGAETVFTYDENGNRISEVSSVGKTVYTYDAANRLVGYLGEMEKRLFIHIQRMGYCFRKKVSQIVKVKKRTLFMTCHSQVRK